MIVCYLHGGCFSGGKPNDKSFETLQRLLKSSDIKFDGIYTIPFSLDNATTALTDITNFLREAKNKHDGSRLTLIGVSSGGWYAEKFKSSKFVDKVILVCPVIDPFKRLELMKKDNDNRLESFTRKTLHVFNSKKERSAEYLLDDDTCEHEPIAKRTRYCKKNLITIAGTEDKNVPKEIFSGLNMDIIWIEGGTHSLCGLPKYIHSTILDFIRD